jgi:hypothetical protein
MIFMGYNGLTMVNSGHQGIMGDLMGYQPYPLKTLWCNQTWLENQPVIHDFPSELNLHL